MAATQESVVGRIPFRPARTRESAWDTTLMIALALAALLAILATTYFAANAGTTDYPEPAPLVMD